jgi:hypothetical protein
VAGLNRTWRHGPQSFGNLKVPTLMPLVEMACSCYSSGGAWVRTARPVSLPRVAEGLMLTSLTSASDQGMESGDVRGYSHPELR